jgi:predicted esterase
MKDQPFTVNSGTTNYVYVPAAYDDTHQTPITLLVWLHGCGGMSSGDIWTVSPGGSQSWISLTVGGQEGNCWDVDNDPARVLAALADIKTHFNIAPKGVILGGYSSGGDLTYRTAFYNAGLFAGVLVENSSPYRDTGSTQSASLAAASWKLNAVHLAHLQDSTYPINGVRKETDSMTAAGFPMTRIEVDGGHYDDAGAIENGHAVPGTSADLATYLFPYLSMGWKAP